ncbi:hypothetical protein BJQ94_18575 [Cryobacterium sp. SO2]|uniref:HAAS signaling domain-containing protein n=1 Tax=Cryobacterium sp. SO2 TaxID=1897060 RepID=UPI00223E2E67|nr:hypothetical protein [Cryobacterium sp. SO2]WEO77329.1 hypothetical protein BJQ94_18575 [Cryobacterium sp. SO2]
MTTNDSFSDPARRFLEELSNALFAVPPALRTEILSEISGELAGLDADAARSRIAELGDPRAIAADLAAEAQPPGAPVVVSKAYPTAAAIVLTAGWYVIPIVGWIVGLVMIGACARWAAQVRVAAMVASVVAAVIAVLALLLLRGTDAWILGLAVFLVVPLLANIFVGSYLRREWAAPATARPATA